MRECPRRGSTDDQPEHDRARCDDGDLDQVARGDGGATRAEPFQGGDRTAFGCEIAGDALADADACDDERAQPDERQELAELFDEAPEAGRAVGPIADLPAVAAGFAAERGNRGLRIGGSGQRDTIIVAGETAGLQDLRGGKRRQGDQDRGAELETVAGAIGLAGDQAAHDEACRADLDTVPDMDA
jgi:hypothetical protein